MPRFDMPGRKGPMKVVLYPGGRRRVFDLPCDTDDAADIKILRTHPLLTETRPPARPAPAPKADQPQPQDKEV